jgi:hypothetical protein
MGGLASCRTTAEKFIEANKTTRYKSQFYAQRQLNDVVAREFARTGLRVGGRTGLFVSIFMSVTIAAEKIRGEKDVLNAVAAGSIAGGLLSLPKGIVGTGRGVLIGGVVSVLYGLLLQALWTLEASVAPPLPVPPLPAPTVSTTTAAPVQGHDDMSRDRREMLGDILLDTAEEQQHTQPQLDQKDPAWERHVDPTTLQTAVQPRAGPSPRWLSELADTPEEVAAK